MKKTILTITLALTGLSGAWGSPLTPAEALARLSGTDSARRAAMRTPELVYTSHSAAGEAVSYVFTNQGAGEGFMILGADDSLPAMLAWSDTSHFDPADIPDGLQWWLDAWSSTLVNPASTRRYASRTYPSGAISPMVATQWNQTSPYNNLCPIVAGERSVTGCVATAQAQIMKYHQWPTKGTGSKTYQWEYNGTTYSATADFSASAYDWANMADFYNYASTAEQKTAVATLMRDCGIAAEMNYSPDASGASEYTAGTGLITYFGYDHGLTVQHRDWYTAQEWDFMVYEELKAGRPLLYCGNDQSVGHAFVCDGYSANGMFHINWGWGGVSDGYFLLSDLNPANQGTGGGAGVQGFNYGQTILKDLKPSTGNASAMCPIMYGSGIATDATSYNRQNGKDVQIKGVEPYLGFYSGSLETFDATVALRLSSKDGQVQYITVASSNLPPNYGWRYFSVAAMDFPVGEYDVDLVCKSNEWLEWVPVRYPVETGVGALHFKVSSSAITVSDVETEKPEPDPEPEPASQVTATFKNCSHVEGPNGDDEGYFFTGNEYSFTFTMQADGAWERQMYLGIWSESGTPLANSTPQNVILEANEEEDYSWEIYIPTNLDEGRYDIGIIYVNDEGKWSDISHVSHIDILKGSLASQVTATFMNYSHVDGPNGDDEDHFFTGNEYSFTFSMEADGIWNREMYLGIWTDSGTLKATSAPQTVTLEADMAADYTWEIDIPTDLGEGRYNIGVIYVDDNNKWAVISYIYYIDIQVPSQASQVTATFKNYSHVDGPNGDDEDHFFTGNEYSFTFSMEADGIWERDMYFGIWTETGTLVAKSAPQTVTLVAGVPADYTWEIEIPSDLPEDRYYSGIIYVNDDQAWSVINLVYYIDILVGSQAWGNIYLEFPDTYLEGTSEAEAAEIDFTTPVVKMNLECEEGPWATELCIAVADTSDYKAFYMSDYQTVTLETGETETLTFTLSSDDMEKDVVYLMAAWSQTRGQMSEIYWVKFVDDPVAVEETLAEGEGWEYFTLDGRKTDGRTRGILIRRQGNKSEKILIK